MRRLTGSEDDGGAILVLVGLLMIGILAMAALVVDLGLLFAEKRQLQNGADAGALAIAQECARSSCPASPNQRAEQYANANSNDGTSNVDAVNLDTTQAKVTVTTSTRSGNGGSFQTVMPPVFGAAVVPGYNGTTMRASATASWGGIGSAISVPLAISMCDWTTATSGSLSNLPSAVHTIYFHAQTQSTTNSCPPGAPAGQFVPGGFGWLDPATGTCSANVVNGWVAGDVNPNPPSTSGASASTCTAAFFQNLVGRTIVMPIFGRPNPCTFADTTWCDGIRGSGSGAEYYVTGFAGFEVESYKLEVGNGNNIIATNPAPCTGSNDTCIRGRYVSYFDRNAVMTGGTVNYGATAVSLTG